MLRPGLIDMTAAQREDREVFGPLMQLCRVRDFDAALDEANRTAYGLAAGLLSDDRGLYNKFYATIRAGVVSWNRPTTNARHALNTRTRIKLDGISTISTISTISSISTTMHLSFSSAPRKARRPKGGSPRHSASFSVRRRARARE